MSQANASRGHGFSFTQQLRRGLESGLRLAPTLTTLLALLLVMTARVRTAGAATWADIACVALLLASLGGTVLRRFRRSRLGSPRTFRDDVELGAQLIGAAYLVVELFGQPLFPLVYLLMAFLVAFLSRNAGIALLGVALLFDGSRELMAPGDRSPLMFFSHAGFFILFAALYHAVLAAQVAANRMSETAAVGRRLREIEERARAYRLVSSGTDDRETAEDEQKWVMASVREVEGAVGAALEVAEVALETHTCAAFLLSSDDRQLKLHDCRSASDFVRRDAFAAGEGVLGGVLKRGAPVRLCGAIKGISYYDQDPGIRSFIAVPIVEGHGTGALRGVLVADRLEATPFDDGDERVLSTVAGEVLRAIEVERVLTYIRRARDEKDRLYRSIEEMNRATKTAEVLSAALDAARGQKLDFAAVTLVEEENGKRWHRIARVAGVNSGRALEGEQFADNTGLVANVVRYGAPLPGRDVRQMDRPVVFDDATQLKGLASLKIVPLKAGDRILGTLVAGSRSKAAFDDDAVRTLELLAMQAAQSILRANLYEKMEQMATTDGLTGLLNHRTFQSRCDEALLLATRYGKKMSLILTDIDHFKSVNDTYGHPVGDLVLKGVARILRKTARDTDVVARYGGEEFCIVMPETDMKGARVIAERIRQEVQAAVFESELGPLKVTLSLGIATYPESGADKQVLIEKADQCLYFAKRNGRNRSVTVPEAEAGGKLKVAEG